MDKVKKKLIITASISLVFIATVVCGWLFLFSKISKEIEVVNQKKKEIQIADIKIKNSLDLKDRVDEIQEDRAKLNEAFLNQDEVIKFIEKTEELSKIAGVEFNFLDVAVNKDTKISPCFRFDVRGSFKKVFHFLSLFENMKYQTGFKDALLQAEESTTETSGEKIWKGSFNISLTSYYCNAKN